MIQLKELSTVSPFAIQQLGNNINIAKNMRDVFPHPYTVDDARVFLELVAQNKMGHVFAIYNDETFIGIGSIVPQGDVYRNSAEIGYWLGEMFWHKGYATAAVKLLTQYAFNELSLMRIYAGIFADNTASMRVLEKAGYRLEAVQPYAVTKYDKVKSQHLYSIFSPKIDVMFSQETSISEKR